jgi:hypothetical protein
VSCKKINLLFFVVLFSFPLSLPSFKFSTQSSSLNFVGANSQFLVEEPITDFSGTLNLKDNTAATITQAALTDIITFNNGILQTGDVSSVLTGDFDPASTDTISLGSGDSLTVNVGTVVQDITVENAVTATIMGQGKFSSAITLGDASSILKMGITTTLNQSVTGLGALDLLCDLNLDKDIQVPSLVTMNNKSLHYNGNTISVATTHTTGGIIELHSNTTLSQALTIGTGADDYVINGNGNILTLNGSGSILFNGGTLQFNDVHLKGLSDVNFLKGTGLIKVANGKLSLSGDFTRSDGDFLFAGDESKIITNGSMFTISGAGNTLTIDGILLYYDQLNGSGATPFVEASSGTIVKINGGDVKTTSGVGAGAGLVIDTASYGFSLNFHTSSAASVELNNDTPVTPKAIAVNGNGHFLSFPDKAGSYLILDGNVQASFTNLVFKDFDPASITYGDANTTLSFGDDSFLEVNKNLIIESGDKPWSFVGNATVDGNNTTLMLNKASGITVTGAKTLTLKNMRIVSTVVDSMKCLTDTAKINLENVEMVMQQSGFDFDTGDLDINGRVTLVGSAINAIDPNSTFTLSTKGDLTIGENANLIIQPDTTFVYDIDPTDDAGSLTPATDSKRHIKFAYPSSILTLDGCTLQSTDTGIGFDFGTIQIKDNVTLSVSTSVGAEAEFGSQARVNILGGSTLNVEGPVRYISSIWP